MIVADLSNHDESTFDPQCMYEAGVRRVIMGCQRGGAPARRMIPALRDADIEVRDVYAFLGFRNWWAEPTVQAISVAKKFDIPRVWLDAEADDADTGESGNDVTPGQRIARLRECVERVETAGLKCGIYTAKWWWPTYMGNSAQFRIYPLWLGGPYQDKPIKTVDFGGWTDVAIHQYTSSLEICGRGRDANYVFEEDAVTREEYEELLLAVFSGGEQRELDATGKEVIMGRDLRLAIAKDRAKTRAAGVSERGAFIQSVREAAESAGVNAALADKKISEHSRDHAAGLHTGGGTFVVNGTLMLRANGSGDSQ